MIADPNVTAEVVSNSSLDTAIFSACCQDAKLIQKMTTDLLAIISKAGSYRGPAIPLIQFNRFCELAARHNLILAGKNVVDFGCGEARPFGAAIFHYLAGARRVVSVDLVPIADPGAQAQWIAGTILACLFDELRADFRKVGAPRSTVWENARNFNLSILRSGDLSNGLPSAIGYYQRHFEELPRDLRQFDVLVTNSVLEHVQDLPATLTLFRESVERNGFVYADIDYRDHRCYKHGKNASQWEYMLDDLDYSPGYINRVRHTALMKMVKLTGFKVLECITVNAEPSPVERAAFLPAFRDVSEIDLTTLSARILLSPA